MRPPHPRAKIVWEIMLHDDGSNGSLKEKILEVEKCSDELYRALKNVAYHFGYCEKATVVGDVCKDDKLTVKVQYGLPPGISEDDAIKSANEILAKEQVATLL